jgi:ATP:corrinoid adenosyltransferase
MRSSIDQHTLDTEQEDSLMAIDQTQTGIVDVHSGSGNASV